MKAIAIGASSGGPSTLEYILKKLPADLNAVVIVIQHLPYDFTKSMAARLALETKIKVKLMDHAEVLKNNTVYIVPGGHHFFLTYPEYRSFLIESSEKLSPSVDMGFTSVAEHFGDQTTGIILTGMGSDGVIGAKAIKQLGGKVIVQDEASSLVYGMPFAVKLAGFSDEVLPLNQIPNRIIEISRGNAKV